MSRDYNSDRHYSDNFDYETARMDLFDAGLDPDYLTSYDRKKRDDFMRSHGFDPKKYGSRYTDSPSSGKSDSGCFLTTACIKAKGLPDDCRELQTLRAYRDGYLKKRADGMADISEYYAIAPRIVESIDALPDAKEQWTALYERLVLPCVELIRSGENEQAYRLYKDTTLALKKKYDR